MKLKYALHLSLLLVTFVGLPFMAQAQESESALISSMEQRLPSLMELKLAGKIGENNLALVEPRESLARDERRLVADENRDRLAQYGLIAARLGVTVAAVQQKRAEQIRENSPKGVWLQSPAGDWYRK